MLRPCRLPLPQTADMETRASSALTGLEPACCRGPCACSIVWTPQSPGSAFDVTSPDTCKHVGGTLSRARQDGLGRAVLGRPYRGEPCQQLPFGSHSGHPAGMLSGCFLAQRGLDSHSLVQAEGAERLNRLNMTTCRSSSSSP